MFFTTIVPMVVAMNGQFSGVAPVITAAAQSASTALRHADPERALATMPERAAGLPSASHEGDVPQQLVATRINNTDLGRS